MIRSVLRNVAALLLLLCLVLAGASLWRQLDRPVRVVRVEGALTPAEQNAIRQVVSGSVGDGLLSLDVAGLCQRIRALSWPRSVAVRRVWPDALVIRVEKESVVAEWGNGGWLNSAGQVVQLADGAKDVPVLVTALSQPRRAMEVYQMLQSRVAPAGFSITRLEENDLGDWVMTFGGGMTVALGSEDLSGRLDRFLLAYRKVLSQHAGRISHVDLRYDSGLAVAWAGDSDVAAASRPRSSAQPSRPGGRSHGVDTHAADRPGNQYALR